MDFNEPIVDCGGVRSNCGDSGSRRPLFHLQHLLQTVADGLAVNLFLHFAGTTLLLPERPAHLWLWRRLAHHQRRVNFRVYVVQE